MADRREMPWRFPFGAPPPPWPPIPVGRVSEYPALRSRIEDLDRVLLPPFTEHDGRALAAQRRYRRYQLALIVGAALTSFFGALQAALDGSVAIGIVVAAFGFTSTAIVARQRRDRPLSSYLTERAKAEELRSLYFRYLSGTAPSDAFALEAEVAVIVAPREDVGRS